MAPHPQRLTVSHRAWPLKAPLEGEAAAGVVLVEIADGDSRGRAECVPLRRFGESVESVVAALEAMKGAVSSGLDRDRLQQAMPPGAARNGMDCAFWAIEANRSYCTVAELAGLDAPKPVSTALTIGCDTPGAMAERAAAHRGRGLLRLELGGEGDAERVRAVRQAVPAARLIVDVQERWDLHALEEIIPVLIDCRIELIEQPLPVGAGDPPAGPIAFCADESCRTVADLDRLAGAYGWVNIKLDKVGGLTQALALAAAAKRLGLRVMVGGGVSTSLGVAPALLVAQGADLVDLEGPLRLASDRASGLRYDGGMIGLADPKLWGGPG